MQENEINEVNKEEKIKKEEALKVAKQIFININHNIDDIEANRENVRNQVLALACRGNSNKEKQNIEQLIIDNFDEFYDAYLEDFNLKQKGQGLVAKIKEVEKQIPIEILRDWKKSLNEKHLKEEERLSKEVLGDGQKSLEGKHVKKELEYWNIKKSAISNQKIEFLKQDPKNKKYKDLKVIPVERKKDGEER